MSPSDHSAWEKSFSEQVRARQVQADSDAWHAVTGLLLFIISIGIILASTTVLTVWWLM